MKAEEPFRKAPASNGSAISKTTNVNEGKKVDVRTKKVKRRSPKTLYPRETHVLSTARYMAKEKGTTTKMCPHVIAIKKSMDQQQEPSRPVFHTGPSAQAWSPQPP